MLLWPQSATFQSHKGGWGRLLKDILYHRDLTHIDKNGTDNLEKGCRTQEKKFRAEKKRFRVQYWPRPPISGELFRGQVYNTNAKNK